MLAITDDYKNFTKFQHDDYKLFYYEEVEIV